MTVTEMMDRMTVREFRYWQAVEVLDGPLGGNRMDYLVAMICKTLADVMTGEGTDLQNFLFEWDTEAEVQKRAEHLESQLAEDNDGESFDIPDEDDEEVDGIG